ncbi:hypothetical protein [Streptomyces sp. NBC_01481]|uniref:hypothetical protein n=1 Tax=Streptomyces sp. NBC_01481 TaxID=2975869 RepID=UPI002253CF2D|nr:hypothetical protein [Streptomyces sp. NBC_01481]MCX4586254.1 hypothetical protein [Streptomyces sp. NBC_01481]
MSPADLAVDAGRCWLDLGNADRAGKVLDKGLQLLAPSRARTVQSSSPTVPKEPWPATTCPARPRSPARPSTPR